MCLSVPYGSNDRPPGRWQLLRQLPGFLWLFLRLIVQGLAARIRHPG